MGSSRPKILGAYLTERLSVYDCPESCGADFSGPCGVAQSARVGAGGLLVHGGLPENGNLRLGATNATSSSLGSEIGRASCRERVDRPVEESAVQRNT